MKNDITNWCLGALAMFVLLSPTLIILSIKYERMRSVMVRGRMDSVDEWKKEMGEEKIPFHEISIHVSEGSMIYNGRDAMMDYFDWTTGRMKYDTCYVYRYGWRVFIRNEGEQKIDTIFAY